MVVPATATPEVAGRQGFPAVSKEVTIEYSEAILRQAARRFWVRFIGWDGFLAFGIAVAGFATLLFLGNRSWYTGAIGAVCAMGLAVGLIAYPVYLKRALSIFRQMETPQVTFRFDEEGISAESDLGSSSIQWKLVKKLWRFPDVWLLMFSNSSYSVLPLASIDAELKEFIIESVRKSGGKVS